MLSLVSDIKPGDRKVANLFFTVYEELLCKNTSQIHSYPPTTTNLPPPGFHHLTPALSYNMLIGGLAFEIPVFYLSTFFFLLCSFVLAFFVGIFLSLLLFSSLFTFLLSFSIQSYFLCCIFVFFMLVIFLLSVFDFYFYNTFFYVNMTYLLLFLSSFPLYKSLFWVLYLYLLLFWFLIQHSHSIFSVYQFIPTIFQSWPSSFTDHVRHFHFFLCRRG